ncbi:DUF2333 family protein [Spongorhabdus nitratireducens]
MEKAGDQFAALREKFSANGKMARLLAVILLLYVVVVVALGIWWSRAPEIFSVRENAAQMAEKRGRDVVTGFTTTSTVIHMAEELLNKPGGFIRNDIMPPGLYLDNISNWEHGVLVQIRDMSRALRKDMSRSQSQSKEDPDLAMAEPQFNFNDRSWALPSSEGQYERGIKLMNNYLMRLSDPNESAQFYARADNLASWIGDVGNRLGSLSQRLSASVGKPRLNTDLAGDPEATQSTPEGVEIDVKTPWLQIDDVFYEARGTSWALIHLLKAVEVDFADVLAKKNAQVSLRQIIRELEGTQETLWSPMVLNGSGFGVLANHSLVMANYISRANAALIQLRELLEQG